MPQALINALATTAAILPIALDVLLVYRLFRFFPFTSAAILSLAPYLAKLCSIEQHPLLGAAGTLLLLSILALLGGAFLARRLPMRGKSSLNLFLLSLGVMVVMQNVLALFFGRQPIPLALFVGGPIRLGDFGVLGSARVGMLLWAAFAIALVVGLQRFTRLGLHWRSLADDPELAEIVGLEPRKPLIVAFAVGALLTGGAGILLAADTAMTPSMGLREFMIAVVAVVVGGHRLAGVLLATAIVSSAGSIGAYLLGGRWQDAIVFLVLIGFLIFRPRGLMATMGRAQTV